MKKLRFIVISLLVLVLGFASFSTKVLAATGGGTATIAVDGGSQGTNVTVLQSTSHVFTTVLTIPGAGMTLGASSPTFTIPTGFTAPTVHAAATSGDVDADGKWSVAASGGGCAVSSSPVSSITVASGQVITVDITADCASGNTITLTYKGTSSIAMGATALTVSTADAGDTSPVTPLIAGSPTITVTAASTPTPSPIPNTDSTSASASSGSGSSSGGVTVCNSSGVNTIPSIIEAKRVSPSSIFISWGPYAGLSDFVVQYGTQDGIWQYNTKVSGFSTTINSLPLNQPIWIRVAATDNCVVGTYGPSILAGGPGLPNTGFDPNGNNNFLNTFLMSGFISLTSVLFILIFRTKLR